MRKFFIITVIFSMLFLIGINCTYAWTSYTHTWICNKAGLTELDCANADYPAMQSKYHDLSPVNHHCANNASDCNARKIADKYALINTTEARGFAAHLYADSLVPVHWYSTDYNTCHKIFEDKVEEKLRNTENVRYTLFKSKVDLSSWNITMQCIAKEGKTNVTVVLNADNQYMDSVARYVAEKMGVESVSNAKTTTEMIKEYDLTPIIYIAIAFLIIIFALFLYYGLKAKQSTVNIVKIKKRK